MGRVHLRIYKPPLSISETHSFHVGNDGGGGGVTGRLSSFLVRDDATFSDLRRMIEWREEGGMYRRTTTYCEVLRVMMEGCGNPHGRGRGEMREYRFAKVVSGNGDAMAGKECKMSVPLVVQRQPGDRVIPVVVSADAEDEPIVEVAGSVHELDLVLVPLSQIRPSDGKITAVRDRI